MDRDQLINITIDLLNEGQSTSIKAYGISMFPTLLPGDILTITPSSNYCKGDVVVFKGSTSLIAHRIVKINGTIITCKGDSVIATDKSLTQNQILGKVIARNRKGRYRPVNHWTFKIAGKIMPHLSKYPSMLIRLMAIVYLKIKGWHFFC